VIERIRRMSGARASDESRWAWVTDAAVRTFPHARGTGHDRLLAGGIHFRRDWHPPDPWAIGVGARTKRHCAMGGEPVASFVVALPAKVPQSGWTDSYAG